MAQSNVSSAVARALYYVTVKCVECSGMGLGPRHSRMCRVPWQGPWTTSESNVSSAVARALDYVTVKCVECLGKGLGLSHSEITSSNWLVEPRMIGQLANDITVGTAQEYKFAYCIVQNFALGNPLLQCTTSLL